MAKSEPSALEKSEQNGAGGSGKKEVGGTSKPCPQEAEALNELKITAALPAFEAEAEELPAIQFETKAEELPAVQFEVEFADPGDGQATAEDDPPPG